jgi:hypothetical protein
MGNNIFNLISTPKRDNENESSDANSPMKIHDNEFETSDKVCSVTENVESIICNDIPQPVEPIQHKFQLRNVVNVLPRTWAGIQMTYY